MDIELKLISSYQRYLREVTLLQDLQGLSTLYDFYLLGETCFHLLTSRQIDRWEIAFVPKGGPPFNHHILGGLNEKQVYGQHFYDDGEVKARFQQGAHLWKRYGGESAFKPENLCKIGTFNIHCVVLKMNADISYIPQVVLDYPVSYTKSFESGMKSKVIDISPMRLKHNITDSSVEWMRKYYLDFLRWSRQWSIGPHIVELEQG